jgi:hypothetical protein
MVPPLAKQRRPYRTNWGHVETGLPSRFWHSAFVTPLAVKQLEVTGRATSSVRDVRLGRPAAQDDALGGRLG